MEKQNKTTLKKQQHEKCLCEHTMNGQVDIPLKSVNQSNFVDPDNMEIHTHKMLNPCGITLKEN